MRGMSIRIAACYAQIAAGDPPARLKLIPAGEFRGLDGRGAGDRPWLLDAQGAARCVRARREQATDLVIDYEHQSLQCGGNGMPNPAAGWMGQMEAADDGLYALDVRWTARAAQMIRDGEYRYLSPVFEYEFQSGRVIRVLSAALTNTPNLDEIGDIALRAAAHRRLSQEIVVPLDTAIATALGVAEDATADTAVAAIAALRRQADTPDPAKWVPATAVAAMQADIAALRTAQSAAEVAQIIDGAMREGRLVEALRPWAESLGRSNPQALRDYVAAAQAIPALTGTQSGGQPPAGGDPAAQLTEAEREVAAKLMIDPAAMAAQKALAARAH